MHEALIETASVVAEIDEAARELHAEVRLAGEISELWSAHVRAEGTIKRTIVELRTLRLILGEQLYRMKKLLSKPGRNGGWASFLAAQNIPLSTADRYVLRYEASLNMPPGNIPTDQISQEAEVHEMFQVLWPRLRRALRTQTMVFEFIRLLTDACGNSSHEVRENGIFVFRLLLDNPAIRAFAEGWRAADGVDLGDGTIRLPYIPNDATVSSDGELKGNMLRA
jgi:hypothetical protein